MDIHNRKVVNTNVAWANNDAANTSKTVDFKVVLDDVGFEETDLSLAATHLSASGRYLVLVFNPSTESALTVQPQILWDDDQATPVERVADLRDDATDKDLNVPVNSTKGMIFEGFVLGKKARLRLRNDTLIGAAGAFTARVQVRAL